MADETTKDTAKKRTFAVKSGDWRGDQTHPEFDFRQTLSWYAANAGRDVTETTGVIRVNDSTLETLRASLRASGTSLTVEEVVDQMAKAYGFKDGKIEVLEPRGPRGQRRLV